MTSRLYTIRAGLPFVDLLAQGLLDETAGDPLALSGYTVLLPTRRACRALREAFLRVGEGRALLLPAMRPLGEVDEEELILGEVAADGLELDLPPAIPDLQRRLALARLIVASGVQDDPTQAGAATPIGIEHAARLAIDLARLIDQAQTERLDFARLATLVEGDLAQHWQHTLDFLRIVTEQWPAAVAAAGYLDPADRRNRLLAAQAAAWQAKPPSGPVIAAGSTGSVPATADLLAVVAALPQGRVVLPGFDRSLDAAARDAARRAPTHPQHGMLMLLDRLGAEADAVADWPVALPPAPPGDPQARARLAAEAMRPAETTEHWRDLPALPPSAVANLQRIDCGDERSEATVVALHLRQALEEPGRTAALVTPNRALARRVAATLRRWGIEIDDSAGQPLADTPPGTFLRLTASMVASDLSPVALLAALKHPLAAGGMAVGAFRGRLRGFETGILRGPRPGAGFTGLRAAAAGNAEAQRFVGLLESLVAPLAGAMAGGRLRIEQALEAHIRVVEALAATDSEAGANRLWTGDAGEALAAFVAELAEAAAALPPVDAAAYPALLDALLQGRVVRPAYGRHPRLHIWGPLEGRLQHADLTILGGLNEGVWPREPAPDPWLSRPMRAAFGLPPPERRVGLAAHDFVQAFAGPEVVLTRAAKSEGAPTVPSRFLSRLDAVLAGTPNAKALRREIDDPARQWQHWAQALDMPAAAAPVPPPAPRPPVTARPRRLSVTRIETWMRDPYAIFARYVLDLVPLDPLEADPGAAEHGNVIHKALDDFAKACPGPLPEDAEARLIALGEAAFGPVLARPAVRAFWWPRFLRIARWFLERERTRRQRIAATATEVRGRLIVPAPQGDFTLTATADRIDTLAEGGYAIVDYKTGRVPGPAEVALGFSPQLPLEAAILQGGGFEGLAAAPVRELAFWHLSGGETPGRERPLNADSAMLAAEALAGLQRLVAAFDDPATAYAAVPDPARASPFNDYAHLARIAEWSGPAGDGEAA